jgi:hypothetical protein
MSSGVMYQNNGSIFDNALGRNFRYWGKSRNSNNNKINFEEIDDDNELENNGEMLIIKVPASNIDRLQHESDTRQVSLNTRINQIIKDHLDWNTNALPTKVTCVPKSVLAKAINQFTEQQLSELVHSFVSDLYDLELIATRRVQPLIISGYAQ